MVSFIKQQLLIVSSVVNFMLSFKIRYNIKFLRAKCSWFFNFFFLYFKAAQSLQRTLLKLKSSVVIQISLLHSINRCLRNPSSAFSLVHLWSGTDITLFILHSLTSKMSLSSSFRRTRTGWGKTRPFLSSQNFSIPRAVATAWLYCSAGPGKSLISLDCGQRVKPLNSRERYIWYFSV